MSRIGWVSRVAPKSLLESTLKRCVFVSLIAIATVMVDGVSGATNTATSRASSVQRGTRITDTTLGAGTQVVFVDMLSSALGYGVADISIAGRGWSYLVLTTDVGNTWTVRGALPIRMDQVPLPEAYSSYSAVNAPVIHFVSAQVAYALAQNGPLYVTNDGGTSWSKVKVPGIWPSYVINGTTLSVVSDVCSRPVPAFGPLKCPSDLSQFRVGTTTPTRAVVIPAIGPAKAERAAVALASSTPASVIVVEGGGEGTPSSLLETSNAGANWQLLNNPCGGLMVDRLFTSQPSRWLLHCFGDPGMSQGSSQLWSSRNGGKTWSIVARASQGGSDHSQIGDVENTLYFNSNHSMLYGALGGAARGLEYSTDMGAHWSMTKILTNWYGGAPEYVSTFDTTSAIFGIVGGPQYKTVNGTTWTELPSLPAGKYKGKSICTTKEGTKVSLNPTMTGIPSTTLDFPVIFTNEGNAACYLNGWPSVQPVSGTKRISIGRAAYPAGGNGRGGFVILKAHGGVASIVVASDQASYPRNYCAPKTMTGIQINFSPPSAFYLSTPKRSVCTGVSTVSNGGVVKGVVTWL